MEEIWKDAIGYEGIYQVSNFGRVKNIKTKRILKQYNIRGYLCVYLYSYKNKRKKYYVHRLVALNFIPNPEGYEEVNHIDEDKTNNKVNNLEWCTKLYNANFGNRKQRISKNNPRIRPVCQYDLNGNLITTYENIRQASIKTGIRKNGIWSCCINKYSHSGGYVWRYNNE